MELKTFLPLRLGLLTAFHQSAEVNIFMEFCLHLFLLKDDSLFFDRRRNCSKATWLGFFCLFVKYVYINISMPLKQGQAVVHTLDTFGS